MKELIKKLNQVKDLTAGGQPSSDWVLANKEILMSQIQPKQETSRGIQSERIYYFEYFNNLFRQSVLKPVTAFMIVVFVLLGYSATVTVAGDSLPGDVLYPIKTAREKVQLALTLKEEEKVSLQMSFVYRRTDELQKLAKTNNKEAVKKTAQQIVKDVKDVKDKLNKISMAAVNADTEKIVEIAKEVDTKTLEIKQGLSAAHEVLTEDIKEEVTSDFKAAIATTEETGTSALNVIIEKYESGEAKIADSEVALRVAERIKEAEGDIVGVSQTLATASTTQTTIEQAKDLLDQKNFSLALEKIAETNQIVNSSATSTSTSTPQ